MLRILLIFNKLVPNVRSDKRPKNPRPTGSLCVATRDCVILILKDTLKDGTKLLCMRAQGPKRAKTFYSATVRPTPHLERKDQARGVTLYNKGQTEKK